MKTEIKAYAKINLSFEILGKLSNGYHKIKSVFQAVDLYDTITIEKAKKGFSLTGSIICPEEENLATKMKTTLEDFVGKELPCRIHMVKNIPVCAGLGGGSSDAAATLIGLNEIYNLDLSLEQMIKLGSKVGKDVPYFLANKGTALVEGMGEKIKPKKKKVSKFYVLARPHRRLRTAEMYSLYDRTGKTFFELAQELCPDTSKIYEHFILKANECGISGSGPTMFAGFDTYEEAVKEMEMFGIESFNGDFFICKSLKKTYDMRNFK